VEKEVAPSVAEQLDDLCQARSGASAAPIQASVSSRGDWI
jgi:hypothetical protein